MAQDVPAEAELLLQSEPLVAHLATCTDGRPHVAPVWYLYGDGQLSVVTGGKKLRNIRRNRRVACSAEKSADGATEWMVSLLGTATVIDDEAAFAEANRRINEKYGASEDAYGENTLVEIDIGSVSVQRYE